MLALRLQRTGRKKIANYRVIAQEHRFQPTSGKVVANLGHYNPHTKEVVLDTDAIQKYLDNGARPSDAAAKLFKRQGIKLPDWVSVHEFEDKKVIREAEEKAKAEEEAKAAKEEAKAEKAEKAADKDDSEVDEAKTDEDSTDTDDSDDTASDTSAEDDAADEGEDADEKKDKKQE